MLSTGGGGGGDKKKQQTQIISAGFFTQWLNAYHKKHPVNLLEFPRVEYWADTKWEPYKEDIQHHIRTNFNQDAQELTSCLELEIDLDQGNEEWRYTAHFSPRRTCPQTGWIP